MSYEFQQHEQYTITDLDTLKVVADPFRLQILEMMGEEPITVKTVADQLDVKPNKLYYHVNLLEKHGLIGIARTEVVSGIIEKWYQSVARSITVEPTLLQSADDPAGEVGAVITSLLDATRTDVMRTIEQGDVITEETDEQRAMIATRNLFHLTPEQYAEFNTRLRELMNEFGELSEAASPESGRVSLTLILFPLIKKDETDE